MNKRLQKLIDERGEAFVRLAADMQVSTDSLRQYLLHPEKRTEWATFCLKQYALNRPIPKLNAAKIPATAEATRNIRGESIADVLRLTGLTRPVYMAIITRKRRGSMNTLWLLHLYAEGKLK